MLTRAEVLVKMQKPTVRGRAAGTIPITRFMERVAYRPGNCWLWTGQRGSTKGTYGVFWLDSTQFMAHRLMYLLSVGDIQDGLQLDHLCRTPLCVNPLHLEPVTLKENVNRGNSPTMRWNRSGLCKRGHSQVGVEWRTCRRCSQAYQRNYDLTRRDKSRRKRSA